MQILEELNAAIISERNGLVLLEKKSRDMQARLEFINTLESDLKRCLTATQELEELFKTRNKLVTQTKDLYEQFAKNQSALKNSEILVEQLNRQLGSVSEKLSRLHAQQQAKREQVQERLKALRNDYASLSEERSKLSSKIDHSERVVKELESKVLYRQLNLPRQASSIGFMRRSCSTSEPTVSTSSHKFFTTPPK
jgi:chromosome segregation ATPase